MSLDPDIAKRLKRDASESVADAILDRLVHNAYRIELKGESMRKGKTPPAEHEN